jgi:hypothetical protein
MVLDNVLHYSTVCACPIRPGSDIWHHVRFRDVAIRARTPSCSTNGDIRQSHSATVLPPCVTIADTHHGRNFLHIEVTLAVTLALECEI